MVEIADLRDCAPSGLFYGGRAGQKEGILIEGEPWIAKYPRTTRDLMGKHLPSYTSSPVSEYLGSHIYELLGIPVHETMLGYRAGKIVCACRDFTFPNARLFEFKEIKNAFPMTMPGSVPLRPMARSSCSATCWPLSRPPICCAGCRAYVSGFGTCSWRTPSSRTPIATTGIGAFS